jgi:predicted transcriptional regulator
MTAKELVEKELPRWSEHDAEVALRAVERERRDPMIAGLGDAPEDDEEISAEEEASAAEGRADIAAGRTVSHEEMLRRYG